MQRTVQGACAYALPFLAVVACEAAPRMRPVEENADGPAPASAPAAVEQPLDSLQRGDSMPVTVYFIRDEQPVPARRVVPATSDTLHAALAQLLAGPTAAEQAAGLTSWFSPATRDALRSVRFEGDRAIVDFRGFASTIPNASTSLGSAMLLESLNATVFAGSNVDSVEYRFDGSCTAFGEFVQRGCIRYGRPVG